MKKILVLLLMIFSLGFQSYSEDNNGENLSNNTKDIPFKPTSVPTLPNYPHKPAHCPVYGIITDGSVTIFSEVEGEAVIIVTDSFGHTILSDVSDLVCGYTFLITEESEAITISVNLNGREYIAYI